MIEPILHTKLRPPPLRPHSLPRPRLSARLDLALTHRLTLLSAPPGFGKTTLLAEWAQGKPVAWLSLDEGDDDPTRFWNYLLASIDLARPGLTDPARGPLLAQPPAPPEAVAAALLNALADSPALTLLLDDYHLIENDSIHKALAFLVEHLPPHLHLLLASRADPPLPLARLRARGQLLEIRAADLRFTFDETSAFVSGLHPTHLRPDHIATLEARTEGWAAALQLAALSLQGRADPAAFIAEFSGTHHYIVDYLADEILNRQSPEIQNFLLQTSILDRLNAPLCAAVVQPSIPNPQSLLEHLDHANLFLVPLDSDRRWYRYHRLFSDFLRNRLFHTCHDQLPDLHRRASEWYALNGLTDEAIRHAMAAEDWGRAAGLVAEAAPRQMQRGEMSTLLHWLTALPDPVVRSAAALCLFHAWALFLTGHFEAAQRRLTQAEAAPDFDSPQRGAAASLRSTLASSQPSPGRRPGPSRSHTGGRCGGRRARRLRQC